ncbi:MAG: YdeI/OmpD-associated family protein [Ignavibacteriota bacterium]
MPSGSTINRRRYASLQERGLLAAPGVERAAHRPQRRCPAAVLSALPPYIEKQFKADGRAWTSFDKLSPSCRRAYIAWIDSAKREETKEKRLREAIQMLVDGKKLGLK